MAYKNPEDKKAYYRRNAVHIKATSKINLRKIIKRNKEYVAAIKENSPCKDCGLLFPPFCMDFDHVRGAKLYHISGGVARGWSIEKLQAEIDKCDLVCANCHRIRSFNTHDRCKIVESKIRGPKERILMESRR